MMIPADLTMKQRREEREVYPEIREYVDSMLPGILARMKLAQKKTRAGSWHTLEWGALHPLPLREMPDRHQIQLMLEAEFFRKLKAAGVDMKEILPRNGVHNVAFHWSGMIE